MNPLNPTLPAVPAIDASQTTKARPLQWPSELPPPEPQGQRERSGLATCSLPVSSAEALLLRWHLEAAQMHSHARHWGKNNEPTIAGLCRGTADGIRKCLQELRRELGISDPRQPEENKVISTNPET
jgi:hypothetical protein